MKKPKKNTLGKKSKNKLEVPSAQQKTEVAVPLPHIGSKTLLQIAFISLLGAAIYLPSLTYEYSADDGIYTYYNSVTQKGLAQAADLFANGSLNFLNIDPTNSGAYRPFTLLTFSLEHQILGDFIPGVSHGINILLYAVFLGLLGWIMARLFSHKQLPIALALLVLLIYALHPLHVEVVASVKSRDSLLSALLGFLAIGIWLHYQPNMTLAKALGIGSIFFLALLSKEDSITLIAVGFLFSVFFLQQDLRSSLKSILPFLMPTAAYLAIRGVVLDPPSSTYNNILNNAVFGAEGVERMATNLFVYLKYLQLLIFPYPLSWDYSFTEIPIKTLLDGGVWLSLLVWAGLLFLAFRYFKQKGIVSFAILFYICTFSIYANLTESITIGSTLGERFMLVPSLGFCMLLLYAAYRLFDKWLPNQSLIAVLVVTLVISAFYAVKVIDRTPVWKDNLTLFYSGVKDAPRSWRTHILLAEELRQTAATLRKDAPDVQSSQDSATALFEEAVLHYKEGYAILGPKTHQRPFLKGMGICYLHLGDTVTGKSIFINAAKQYPDFFTFFKLGIISFQEKNYPEAADYYQKALTAPSPDYFSTYKNLGATYFMLDQYGKAREAYEKALEYGEGPDIDANLAILYSHSGDFDKALDLMASNPDLSDEEKELYARIGLGKAAYQKGNYAETIKILQEVEPGFIAMGGHEKFPNFLNIWARSYLNLGDYQKAKHIFKRVIQADPKNYYALTNLGNITFEQEKNYPAAEQYFKQCLEATAPDYFTSYSNLGTVYLIQNRAEAAIEAYEKSLEYGSNKAVLGNLYLLWQSKGDEEKAGYYKKLLDNAG